MLKKFMRLLDPVAEGGGEAPVEAPVVVAGAGADILEMMKAGPVKSGSDGETIETPVEGEDAPAAEVVDAEAPIDYKALYEEMLAKQSPALTDPEPVKPPVSTPETPTKAPVYHAMTYDVDFADITDEQIAQLGADPGVSREVMKNMSGKIMRGVLDQLPKAVLNLTMAHEQIKQTAANFYTTNPDLQPYGQMVNMAAQYIESKEPNLGLAEVLAKAGAEVRGLLKAGGIKAPAPAAPVPPKKPAFNAPPAGGARGGGKGAELTDVQKHMKEMMGVG